MIKYQVINESNDTESAESHEYNIVVEKKSQDTVYSLYYSDNSVWSSTLVGQLALQIIDNGNEIIFPERNCVFDYTETSELFILLSFINNIEHKSLYDGKIKVINEIKTFVI